MTNCPCYTIAPKTIGFTPNRDGKCETSIPCQFVDIIHGAILEAVARHPELEDIFLKITDEFYATIKPLGNVYNYKKTLLSTIYGGLIIAYSRNTNYYLLYRNIFDQIRCWVLKQKTLDPTCISVIESIGLSASNAYGTSSLIISVSRAPTNTPTLVRLFNAGVKKIIETHCCSIEPLVIVYTE